MTSTEEDVSAAAGGSGPKVKSWQYAAVENSEAAEAAISKLQKLFQQSYKRVSRAPRFTPMRLGRMQIVTKRSPGIFLNLTGLKPHCRRLTQFRQPANPPPHQTFATWFSAIWRPFAAGIPSTRSEAVLSVCLWWLPSPFPRFHHNSFRIQAIRRFSVSIAFHQPRRQICRKNLRVKVFTRRYLHE
jgi:hypothetical protein